MQFAGRVAQEAAHDSVTRQSGGTVASNPPRDGNNLIFPVGAGVDQEPNGGPIYPKPLPDLNCHVFLGVPMGDDIRLKIIQIVDYNDDNFFQSIRKVILSQPGFADIQMKYRLILTHGEHLIEGTFL